jgi:hypothetical protein
MARGVIYDTGPGPIRATIEAYGSAFTLFTKKERNAVVRQAMESGGWMWIAKYLPLRFTVYAYSLGYHVAAKYAAYKLRKQGHALPNVFTGRSRETATQGANATGRATANKQQVTIKIPLPVLETVSRGGKKKYASYGKQSGMAAIIGTVPASEIAAFAAVVGKEIGRGLQSKWESREQRAPALGTTDNRRRATGKSRQRAA